MPNLINDNDRRTDRRCSILLILITCVAALLRLWQCAESLWLDETHTAWVVADGFANIPSRAKAGNYGPVYFWLPWLSTQLLGMTEFALRLPSLVAGICLVPVCYFIARDWFRSSVLGVLAASLVAIDPHSLFYSLDARPYSLVQLFSAVHVWLLVRILNWQPVFGNSGTYDGLPRPSGIRHQNSAALEGHRTEPTEPTAKPHPPKMPTWSIVSFCIAGVLLFQLHFTSGLLFTAEATIVALAFILGKRRESLIAIGCLTVIGISCLTILGTIQHVAARRRLWNQFIEREAEFRALFPWAEYLGSAIVVAFICRLIAARLRPRNANSCLLYTSPSPRDATLSRMPSSA